jgi:hypothetical protein
MDSTEIKPSSYRLDVGSDRITAELRFMSNWILHMKLSGGIEAANKIISGSFTSDDAQRVRTTVAEFNKTRLQGLDTIIKI